MFQRFRDGWKGSDNGTKGMKKISLGICAMDKKTKSKPMREILSRMPDDMFDITIFGDDCILNKPVQEWPVVEVLIAFYSTNYPTEKALEYVKLRKPFMLNDLEKDEILKDRRRIYELLQKEGINVPVHVYCERDDSDKTNVVEEFDEYIVVNGVQINKPLVEKPVDAEDHNIYIYYPISAGGGSKRLFRKVNDRASEFYPRINELRREGSYIYEEFIVTQGTDVKVYTVGPDYGHAEARKSPVVDGKVNRDAKGMEVRYPVILSVYEKGIVRKIVNAFGQTVCGFDILRVHGKSYCCDVNGFSFVKNSRKYYDDASQLLVEIIISRVRADFISALSTRAPIVRSYPDRAQEREMRKRANTKTKDKGSSSGAAPGDGSASDSSLGPGARLSETNLSNPDRTTGSSSHSGSRSTTRSASPAVDKFSNDGEHSEELRCIIAVTRHGDRTPKQKMKIKISLKKYLDYFHSYSKNSKKDLKVKSRTALVRFLNITREIVATPELQQDDPDLFNKLTVIIDVLERWEISGICRKLQMKPLQWEDGSGSLEAKEKSKKEKKAKKEKERLELEEKKARALLDSSEGEASSGPSGPSSPVRGTIVPFEEDEGMSETGRATTPTSPIETDIDRKLATTSPIPHARSMSRTRWDGNMGLFGLPEPPPLQRSTSQTSLDSHIGKEPRATEILLILKWGGDLTPLGRAQAENMGTRFRQLMYPDNANGGVLRLHATYRHDLKIKASDEGRVMKTAAAFAKGLLELEGQLTPIIASLVTVEAKNKSLLDYADNALVKDDLDRCKTHLNEIQVDELYPDFITAWAKDAPSSIKHSIDTIRKPLKCLKRLHVLIGQLCAQLHRVTEMEIPDTESSSHDTNNLEGASTNSKEAAAAALPFDATKDERSANDRSMSDDLTKKLYLGETYALMLDRWEKLNEDFFNKKTGLFDLSKVPDVYDMIRYDILHNSDVGIAGMKELYLGIRSFENTLVPQEYGADRDEKTQIGSKVCGALLEKIKYDLIVSRSDTTHDMRYMLDHSHAEDLEINSLGRAVRTRLYFTSESHMHTLLNVLRFVTITNNEGKSVRAVSDAGLEVIAEAPELSYLTQVVIRLFEDNVEPDKFRCEISFTPGANNDIFIDKSPDVAAYKTINGNISCDDLLSCLSSAIVIGKELPPEEASAAQAASLDMSFADLHDLHLTDQPYSHGGEDSKPNFSKKESSEDNGGDEATNMISKMPEAPLNHMPNNFEDDDFDSGATKKKYKKKTGGIGAEERSSMPASPIPGAPGLPPGGPSSPKHDPKKT
jgi:glutathione synthase/RimK-type ligase-like ATP-grasp enzyme